VEEAITNINFYASHLSVIFPKLTTLATLKKLLSQKSVTKGKIFDLYLTATALDNGINLICTWNTFYFKGLSGVEVSTPAEILEKLSQDRVEN